MFSGSGGRIRPRFWRWNERIGAATDDNERFALMSEFRRNDERIRRRLDKIWRSKRYPSPVNEDK